MIPHLLLTSSLPSGFPASTATAKGDLLTRKEPLSLQITTVQFKNFVEKSGPMFWFLERGEEILTWKKGWKVTATWMAAFAFLCYYPRLLLLIPHLIIIGIILATSSSNSPTLDTTEPSDDSHAHPAEESIAWQANLQAIQNLMGAVSDAHDFIMPLVPHLTHASPYTRHLLIIAVLSLIGLIPVLYVIPIRPVLLILGLSPFIATHPQIHLVLCRLPRFLSKERIQRIIDDDNLPDACWGGELREVELWENERWINGKSWSKTGLKSTERDAWTRGRDGCSGVGDGEVSNLTFPLALGWSFVETEDWRPDLSAGWIGEMGGDADGWVYTDDAWLNPHSVPPDDWVKGKGKSGGMTRRRRWVRRICYTHL